MCKYLKIAILSKAEGESELLQCVYDVFFLNTHCPSLAVLWLWATGCALLREKQLSRLIILGVSM